MAAGALPPPKESAALHSRREHLTASLLQPLKGLCALGRDILSDVIDVHRWRFARAGKE